MVFVFLQNWRATLIPLLTVPVSLVGAFIFFPLLGFSINVLSLLGLVLAIGIVVDDAIVVVEAVMHHIEHGMTPKEATLQGDGGGVGAGRGHRPHPGRGVRAGRLHGRHHRACSTSSSRSRSRSRCSCRRSTR
ncbi:MAG: efflux RND transporter permease subunit [Bacillus subtilis]|nr:efflux RND transporter permease subunit [Bacillus subtilis]